MIFANYTDEEAEACRVAYPKCWVVEIVTASAACLVAILATKENFERPIPSMPGMSADLLHGATIRSGIQPRTHTEEHGSKSSRR